MKRLYDIDINEYKQKDSEQIKLQAPKKDFVKSVYEFRGYLLCKTPKETQMQSFYFD